MSCPDQSLQHLPAPDAAACESLPSAQAPPVPKRTYQAGTLLYTKMGLVAVFFWLLWGGFCLRLMELVMPALLPLKLKSAHASNFTIGLIVVSIPAALNMILCPIISTWSDRHRGPRGRRIPFLFWPTPFIALFLVLTAYSTDLGTWLHHVATLRPGLTLSRAWAILIVLGICMVGFQVFNMFVGSVYYYLWADVVPQAFLGRFISLFQFAATGGGWIWNYYIFGLASTHMKAIFIGIGVFYFTAFMLMCLRVKEGRYPPPPLMPRGPGGGAVGMVRTYFRECFRNPYYVWFFLSTSLFNMASSTTVFLIFFYRDTLKLSLEQIGQVLSWTIVLTFLLLIPAGWICDKLHPLRVSLAVYAASSVTAFLCFFCIHNERTMLIFLLVAQVPAAFFLAANLPMYASLLPADRYGQFCSAQAAFQSVVMILVPPLAGVFLDWMGNYRYAFFWQAVMTIPALLVLLLVYRGWRRYGGAKNYVAPPVDASAAKPHQPRPEL